MCRVGALFDMISEELLIQSDLPFSGLLVCITDRLCVVRFAHGSVELEKHEHDTV